MVASARLFRPFFRSTDSSKRHRAGPTSSTAAHSTASTASPCTVSIRSYRRPLPASSIVESLHRLLWPHEPTCHSPQSRSTFLSLLSADEQQHFELDFKSRLTEAATALLAVLAALDELCSRPYDLSLHRLRPSRWQLPSLSLLATLLAPFLSSLGLLRDRDEWIVGEGGVGQVSEKVRTARAELAALKPAAEKAAERTGAFDVQTGQQEPQQQRQSEESTEWESSESKYEDDEDDEYGGAAPAPFIRHKSLHSAPMAVRPMPTMPTAVRHSRSTFKADGSKRSSHSSKPAHRPLSAGQRARASDLPYSSRTEAGAHPKALSANVAGGRRTLPITLPHTFLSAAPTIAALDDGPASFTVQPAVLDLGPLLVGCTYTTTLLLTNTSSHYARFDVLLPAAAHAAAASSSVQPPLSLSFAFRRGGLSAGLSKALTVIVLCTSAGMFDCDVVVAGEDGSVRISVCAECMDDAAEWRQARVERDGLSVGEQGLTIASSLPGSLKVVQSAYGRVKEVTSQAAEEESKEQILSAAVLSRWRNKPLRR